jgi:hypothetical protein
MAASGPVLRTVPQLVPVQPAPLTDQVTAVLPLEHTVAANVCCPFTGTLAVAGDTEIGGAQAGLTATAAAEDFDGSATLVAMTLAEIGAGTEEGAVYTALLPLALSVPQAEGQGLPAKLHVTDVAGLPVPFTCAVNCCVAPADSDADAGVTVT